MNELDVLIVGGGVVGLSLAYELTGWGRQVTVVDAGPLGREASWAGAGILTPGPQTSPPTSPQASPAAAGAEDWLRGLSDRLLETWSRRLREETGIDDGYRRCGCLYVAFDDLEAEELERRAHHWRTLGQEVEDVAGPGPLEALEPELSPAVRRAVRLPRGAQLRPPRHVRALAAAVAGRGGRLRPGTPVLGLETRNAKVTAVHVPEGTLSARQVVLAAGPWTGALLRPLDVSLPTRPVKGQMVLLEGPAPVLRHVVWNGLRYVVPRPDGHVLVGSTMEDAGFDRTPDAAGVGELLAFGRRLAPVLGRLGFVRAWAGLRPGSPDGLPSLGRVPGWDNLFVAAGHLRGGFELSAGSARLVAEVMSGEEPSAPAGVLSAFRPGRHGER
jgi:glycine oxidase